MSPAVPGAPWSPVDRFYQFALLGLLGSSFLALATSGAIDPLTIGIATFGLVARVLQLSGVVPFVRSHRVQWIGLGLGLTIGLADYLFYTSDLTRCSIHSAALVIVWKLLTVARSGDLRFLAFGQLIGAAMLSSYSSFALCLALFLFFAVAAYSCSEVRRSAASSGAPQRSALPHFERRMAALSISTGVGILLMTGALFFLLPRTAKAALQHLHLGSSNSGLASEIMLGRLGELKQSNSPVMHIRLHHSNPAKPLKWRGRTLGYFDGRRWTPGDHGGLLAPLHGALSLLGEMHTPGGGERISYEVQMQPTASGVIFFAGIPEAIRIDADRLIRHGDNSFRVFQGDAGATQYTGYSLLLDPNADASDLPLPITAEQRRAYLQLPLIDSRIPALARQIAGGGADAGKAEAIVHYFRTQFRYTTKLLDREVPDPLAYFLFERKQGHCEYFASAMTVMLRTLGIPARIATGFQSGYFNPLSGQQVIRGTDAHAWVEAYLPGRGWATFDPTPAGARPEAESAWARMELYLDAADSFWQEWVLHYDLERQFLLAVRLEQSRQNWSMDWWRNLKTQSEIWRQRAAVQMRQYGIAVLIGALLLLGIAIGRVRIMDWAAGRWRRQRVRRGQGDAADATMLYRDMLAALHRRGMEKPAWLTPTEFAQVLPREEIRPIVAEFTVAYQQVRFGGDKNAATHMLALLETIESR